MIATPHSRADLAGAGFLDELGRNWGWIALRGIVAIGFGILTFVMPGVTLGALVLVWAAYVFVDGIFSVIAAFRVHDQGKPFWALLIVGVLGIAAGVLTFFWPRMTAIILLMFIATWALFIGFFQVMAAVRLRKEIDNEWLLGFSGVLSMLFGIAMIMVPGAGALALIWIIGAYAIFFGVLLLALAFRLRRLGGRTAPPAGATPLPT